MTKLLGKTIAVIGATGSVGYEVVRLAREAGAQVVAAARNLAPLEALAAEFPGTTTIGVDATDARAPERVFSPRIPDVLVLSLGARPPIATIGEQRWDEFSKPWNVDVRASLSFCQAALRRPLTPGSTVILVSSGAGLGGSPISGGYAGAKRMQMFLADYFQEESDRLHLDIRFIGIVPTRIMAETPIGKVAVAAYSRYRGVSEAEFVQAMNGAQTAAQVAEACIALAAEEPARNGNIFTVSAIGIEEIAS